MATERQRQEWIQAELVPGEKIVWTGFPDPIAFLAANPIRTSDIIGAIGAVIIWVLFLIVSATLISHKETVLALTIISALIFSLALTYILGKRPFGAYLQAERTVYALTNRRALIVQDNGGNKGRRIRTLSAEEMSSLEWRERISNAGVNGLAADTNDLIFPHLTEEGKVLGFLAVRDAKLVAQTIRGQLLATRA